eukprot:7377007-Prymnesium_polylepis.2
MAGPPHVAVEHEPSLIWQTPSYGSRARTLPNMAGPPHTAVEPEPSLVWQGSLIWQSSTSAP